MYSDFVSLWMMLNSDGQADMSKRRVTMKRSQQAGTLDFCEI